MCLPVILCDAAGAGYRPPDRRWRFVVSRLSLLRHAALLTALTGCTLGPNFEAPSAKWNPASWFQNHPAAPSKEPVSEAVAQPVDPQWWTLFNDDELTKLEGRIAETNYDVRGASLRLAESRASFGAAQSALLPNLNANGNYTRQQLAKQGVLALLPAPGQAPGLAANGLGGQGSPANNATLYQPFDLYQYGFDASWELDLWGRVRRNIEAAKSSLQAAAEAQRDTLLTALAEMARDYVQLRGTQRNIEITQRNLQTAQQSLKLTQQRASGGVTTDLDVANAAAQVDTVASQLPTLRAQESQIINAIAFLVGQPPESMQAELSVPHPIPPVPPRVPVGLPSELARRRPDIRQAEAQLHAATADVGVAVADFYPRFTLSGSVSMQAVEMKYLGSWADSGNYAFGPSITLPIFQGGQLRRILELRKGQQQEAAVLYQRTVLNALHEVDNALVSYDAEQRRRNQLAQAVTENRRAVKLAQDRYAQGVSDFLTVLDGERNLLAAEQQFNDSITNVSTDLVQIYKALGGGWETALPASAPLLPDNTGSLLHDIL